MSPELKRYWKDEISRLRYERNSYAKRSAAKHKLVIELRKQRRWLDALVAEGRKHEYRRYKEQYDSDLRKIQEETGLK